MEILTLYVLLRDNKTRWVLHKTKKFHKIDPLICASTLKVKVFLVLAPPIEKMWNSFVGFWFFGIRYLQQYIFVHYSNVSYVIEIFYVMNLFVRWKTLCVNHFFFGLCKIFIWCITWFNFLVLVNNLFLCGLLALSIISFENEFSYPFICFIFVYYLNLWF